MTAPPVPSIAARLRAPGAGALPVSRRRCSFVRPHEFGESRVRASGAITPGQDSSPPRRGGVSIPAAQTCSKSRSSATRKSTNALPTYGAVSLLLHGVTISPGSPTLQMLRCTEVSQQNDVMGHSHRIEVVDDESGLPPTSDISLRRGERRDGPSRHERRCSDLACRPAAQFRFSAVWRRARCGPP